MLATQVFRPIDSLPLLVGLLVLFIPTYYTLFNGLWLADEQAHGPIVMVMSYWLLWSKRDVLLALPPKPANVSAWALLLLGCCCYVVGRSQDIVILELGAQIPILATLLLFHWGWRAVRVCLFPLFFLIFMLPLPGAFVDAATAALKLHVSAIAESLLYGFGYPVARNGVMLNIGQYQLLVADACSGLHSMFSLSAMGLLYLYLMEYRAIWRNILLAGLILPIAFIANVVRVIVLVLITFYQGNEAAQGFVHGFAGIFLFIVALLGLLSIDALLGLFGGKDSHEVSQ
ncbi:exosortase B [Chitinivorax tropicus]|uniref:Exosortase B n=1 Tax=Chitinivorax tropicus TaxID=714531 RepID=A0A840MWN3_9PROT|nr:exosortase B [Chitinivorax tropicus]MBB5019581.1 exosortase B [Chitinivorax tropicus]